MSNESNLSLVGEKPASLDSEEEKVVFLCFSRFSRVRLPSAICESICYCTDQLSVQFKMVNQSNLLFCLLFCSRRTPNILFLPSFGKDFGLLNRVAPNPLTNCPRVLSSDTFQMPAQEDARYFRRIIKFIADTPSYYL